MTSVRVAVERADGGVSLMSVVLNDGRSIQRTATAETIEGEILRAEAVWPVAARRDVDGNLVWQIYQPGDVPVDRTFRDAWTLTEFGVLPDLPKARDVHRARMRRARQQRFMTLDAEFTRRHGLSVIARRAGQNAVAATHETEMEAIESQRQQLRDAPQDAGINAATTIDQLKAVWPAILDG